MLAQALNGIRVLDFTRLYPGPLCTMMLSDLGAGVIKVEAPGGEMGRSMGSAFSQLNRNKRSLTLDLQKDQARGIVRKLLDRSDILVESFRPGVMRRYGLDYESLRHSHPRLIYCSITGYGQTGGNAQRPGHDLNYISMAGIVSCNGSSEKGYVIPPVQIADTMGAFQAVTAILAALLQRQRTNAGEYLDISLLDGAFFTMILLAAESIAGLDPHSEQYLAGKLACYNIYRTSDGRYLAVAVLEPKFWRRFCAKMELPRLMDCQFQENQAELIEIISGKLSARPLLDWVEFFSDEDVCITPVNTVQEALQSDYLMQRGLLPHAEDSRDPSLYMRTPFVESVSIQGAPELSEHTHEILKEAGYTETEVREFVLNKVV